LDIVLTHTNSDFDAIGATVAASKLYPGAVPVLHNLLLNRVRDYVAVHKTALGFRHLDELNLADVTRAIVVDTQSPGRLGQAAEALDRPGVDWIVYDHHPGAAGDLPPSPGRRELMGSTCTMLTQELEKRRIALTPLEATTIALGIYTDTGGLTYPSTGAADARAVAYLLEQGADVQIISEYDQDALTMEQQAVFQALSDGGTPQTLRGLTTLVAGAAWPEEVLGISTVTHKLIELLNLDVTVVAVEMGKRIQIVARSRVSDVDVLALLAPFSPRGHRQAASAHTKGVALSDVLTTLQELLPNRLPPEPTAADLMSTPVRTIASDVPIAEALQLLIRYGHSGFVVVDDGHVVGVVSRRDIDRAAHHDMGHVPVKGIMSREVVTVTPDVPLSEVEQLMITHNVGRLPVLFEGALVGVVTRTDLLRVMYAHRDGRKRAVARETSEMTQLLQTVWPKAWWELAARIGEIAGDRPLYLVGGSVRDLLLGVPNLDVDVVVEGDGIALAQEVAAAMPGTQLDVHPQFGTARLLFPDGRKVDVATARTEFYTHPAALPTVEFSSIKQDLFRRDFSVNALALRLNTAHFGELLDFFSSRGDLERRTLRVLHNLSFIEDPTRLLRGVRFEQQLGFGFEAQTEAFARYAMRTGRFDGMGGDRIKRELKRILSMPAPLPAAKRISALDGWRLVHPALKPADDTWRLFARARHLMRVLGEPARSQGWLTYLTILLRGMAREDMSTTLSRLSLNKDEQHEVFGALDAEARLAEGPALETLGPAARYRRLEGYSQGVMTYLAVVAPGTPTRRALVDYWTRLRPVKLSVDGKDLRAAGLPPGPQYGEILKALMDARLTGTIETPDEERALLAELAAQARKENETPC
jgi:tRNA nucleotidyltransferase (CCA-adding enzyme)